MGRTRTVATLAAMTICVVGLAACDAVPVPPIDDPTSAGGGSSSPGSATSVELPGCPGFDASRDYDPPPEQQPATDPALTSPELIEDLDVGGFDDADQVEVPDGAAPPAAPTPMSAAQRWAQTEAPEHFAGVWFDGDHGAAVIAFTDDVDRYAAEVRDRFGTAWWVVRADRSLAELTALSDAVGQVTTIDAGTGQPGSIIGWGPREDRGVVGVDVVGGDEQALQDLAAQLDDPAYCFSVIDPPTEPNLDDDAPVRTLATVPGWRDGLAVELGALLEIAYDLDAAQQLVADNVPDDHEPAPADEPWEDGRHGDLDGVDLATHVVAVYTAGRSGSCPEWVADVTTSADGVVVHREVPSRGACTDDFNPYRTVITIERDRVPSADELPTALDLGYDIAEGAVVAYPVGE